MNRNLLSSSVLLLLAAACSSGSSGPNDSVPVSSAQSTVQVLSTGVVVSDSVDGARLQVLLRDDAGRPLAQRRVSVRASGAANDFLPAASVLTDVAGRAELRWTSGEAGRKRAVLSVTNSGISSDLPTQPEVDFVPTSVPRRRVSVRSDGAEAEDFSGQAAVSGNGRFIAFQSKADNLVAGDSNQKEDVFVHDRDTAVTERVSLRPNGSQFPDLCGNPSLSDDGWLVAFEGRASDTDAVFVRDRISNTTSELPKPVAGSPRCFEPALSGDGRFVAYLGNNGEWQRVFVYDRVAGTTTMVSRSTGGAAANGACERPSISRDGRFVAFASIADNLVSGDSNDKYDVFVHDRVLGTTIRASVNAAGGEGNDDSVGAAIAADGAAVAFASKAANLVLGDDNGKSDVFVRDLVGGSIVRASVDPRGQELDQESWQPTLSADGTLVVFASLSDLVTDDDQNGKEDVFCRDLVLGTNVRVSMARGGGDPNEASTQPAQASDAPVVAFTSKAQNLVASDENDKDDVFVAPRN